jgi:hypothetical protein
MMKVQSTFIRYLIYKVNQLASQLVEKVPSLCELCNVPHILNISKGSIHNAKILETIINDKLYNNYKYLNIIGDKGYIKNAEYINYIQSKNIRLIMPLKINAICNNKLSADKTQLLKDRYKVEHFFS